MTSMNIPNSITNGTVADATDVQENFDHIESHVNTEVVNRDGSVAMTGELLLPSNPTSNLAAATKSYVDLEVGNEESARITAVSNEATTRANADTALDTRVTALEGTDIDVELTGNVTGSGTITNLGDVSFATTIANNAVTTAKIANDAITNDKIATNAVNADSIAAGAVGSTELASTAVTAGSYGNEDYTTSFTVDSDGRLTSASNVRLGGWSSYNPVLTGSVTNPSLGTGGVAEGYYTRVGDLVVASIRIKFGTSGTSNGAGNYFISLPVNAEQYAGAIMGHTYILDASGGYSVSGIAQWATSSKCYIYNSYGAVPGPVSSAIPFTWTDNDEMRLHLSYRAS